MSIKVIGAGLGRTGTLSLKAALEELGFARCYHLLQVFASMDHARIWDAAVRGEPVDWNRLFDGYRATVDLPGCVFYRELMENYPEAKVILTMRDPERWYDSARQTILFASDTFPSGPSCSVPGCSLPADARPAVGPAVPGPVRGPGLRHRCLQPAQRAGAPGRARGPPPGLRDRPGLGPALRVPRGARPGGEAVPAPQRRRRVPRRVERHARMVRTFGYAVIGAVVLFLILIAAEAIRRGS